MTEITNYILYGKQITAWKTSGDFYSPMANNYNYKKQLTKNDKCVIVKYSYR